MLSTIIVPNNVNIDLHFKVPPDFLGKKTKIIVVYELEGDNKEPLVVTSTERKKPSDFFGILTKEEGEKFQKHIQQARGEWDRNI